MNPDFVAALSMLAAVSKAHAADVGVPIAVNQPGV